MSRKLIEPGEWGVVWAILAILLVALLNRHFNPSVKDESCGKGFHLQTVGIPPNDDVSCEPDER